MFEENSFGCLRKTKQFSHPIATSGNRRRNNIPFDRAIPYQAEGKPVVKIGIAFSQEAKTVSDWIIEKA